TASEIMLLCAFLLKGAVFPFHFWQPDFHTTAPTPVSAVLSSVVVKIGIYGIIRMETLLFITDATVIGNVVLVLGIISVFFGGLGALGTYNGKRMLAYSTFGQIGFILLGIGWGTPLAMAAALVYAFNHAFIKSALLMLFGVVASRTKEKTAALVDTVGVGKTLPGYVGLIYLAGGLALAGLPPMNGFMSKFALMRSGVDSNAWWIVGLAIGGGLLTTMYMMRTWQNVFQRYPGETTAKLKDEGVYDKPYAPAILIGACLALGLVAQPLFDVAERTVEQISDPQIYISATFPQTESVSLEVVAEGD
ncbi:MAG: complex I subunit 5 family protein, partial [Chloroflexota bacterium]